MGFRVGQGLEHVDELDDRPRPPVRHDQRKRIRSRRPHMQEVDVLTVDRGLELSVPVETSLPCPPVVSVEPAIEEAPNVWPRHSVVRAGTRLVCGPARPLEPESQVLQVVLRDLYPERCNELVSHALFLQSRGSSTERARAI